MGCNFMTRLQKIMTLILLRLSLFLAFSFVFVLVCSGKASCHVVICSMERPTSETLKFRDSEAEDPVKLLLDYIYIYIHTHIHIYIHICMYIYIYLVFLQHISPFAILLCLSVLCFHFLWLLLSCLFLFHGM